MIDYSIEKDEAKHKCVLPSLGHDCTKKMHISVKYPWKKDSLLKIKQNKKLQHY